MTARSMAAVLRVAAAMGRSPAEVRERVDAPDGPTLPGLLAEPGETIEDLGALQSIELGRRAGRTAAALAVLRCGHVAMLAQDGPGTRELAEREGLAVEPVVRGGKPSGLVWLRAIGPALHTHGPGWEAWEDGPTRDERGACQAALGRRGLAGLGYGLAERHHDRGRP